jgi:hypothetical protein
VRNDTVRDSAEDVGGGGDGGKPSCACVLVPRYEST